jgi:phage terminase large subunit-like protein
VIYQPVEDHDFVYDPVKAERPIRFIHKFCRHYEGAFAGKPFELIDWQQLLLRTAFGWVWRVTGYRRFTEIYLESAKAGGKTPLMAAIGMFLLCGDDEPGAHVISAATDYPQASLTLDAGKQYVHRDGELGRVCRAMQYAIRGPRASRWTAVSGTAEGKHGLRPSGLLMDEAHEWPNGLLYSNLTANMTKRSQPMTIVSTNSGKSRTCFAWKLRERAIAVMEGKPNAARNLLPAIFMADDHLPWDSEEAAAAANPSWNVTTNWQRLQPKLQVARESPEEQINYERLYLSRWPKQNGGTWLNMTAFDACCIPFNASDRAEDPLYVGLDMSRGDDLCSAVYVWPTPDVIYVAEDFWMTRDRAEHYAERCEVPYIEWAAENHITLLNEKTIDKDVQIRIAKHIAGRAAKGKLKAVCYDRAYVGHTIATLEADDITCVPIPQGWSLSPGCDELERRLKEQTIQIVPNPVMRFCAANAEVTGDNRGNIWPVKPGAKDKYAGKRGAKIDGIVALVTALVEARKFDFPKPKKTWKGKAVIV